ncbi:MAG: putative DNA binding domain-containing protein [Lentisphaeria bacterium]|nr:putative DNA binding domain-containing protein [Lentisphaeria bacterium]
MRENFSLDDLKTLIQGGETLSVEFKGDWEGSRRSPNGLPDKDLVTAVVSLANTKGGYLLLGVEDNGDITGLRPRHQDPIGMAAMIANRTNPALSVEVSLCDIADEKIAIISVPNSHQLVSTSEGLLVKRRMQVDGKPEAVPFYPHEFISRQSSFGLIDPSAIVLTDIAVAELDPLQRIRLRKAVKTYMGDSPLLNLADDELDGALGLIAEKNGAFHPTAAGLLILGSESLLRQHLPSYEVAFQVLQNTQVKVNEFYRKPLLETFEAIEQQMKPWIVEKELDMGLFRVPVPNYDRTAFREAFINALVHRDFSVLGFVQIKLDDDGLTISSPGGFISGVTLENLLVTPPRSRNPLLADIIKRIGLAERTGRGIDRIYEGMLRYGRPAPDYSASNESSVTVFFANAEPDLNFMKMLIEQEDKGSRLPIDSLIILSRLREERRLGISDLTEAVQKSERAVHADLEKLTESGILERQGTGRGSTYMLSAKIYVQAGKKAEYVRQVAFSALQQRQMVLRFIDEHGSICRADVMELCHLTGSQAYHLLHRLVKEKEIHKEGILRYAVYKR